MAASEVKRPLRNRFGSETAQNLYSNGYMELHNGHTPTDKNIRLGVRYCSGYVTAVTAGQSQRFYSGMGIFNWYYLSSTPRELRLPGADLE